MTAPFYPNAEVLENTGEAVSSTDLNNMQRFAKAVLMDMIVGGRARQNTTGGGDENGASFNNSHLGAFGAAPVPSGAASTLTCLAGTLIHYPSALAFDGSDAFSRAAYVPFNAGPLGTVAIAAADPSNPRVDSICVQVSMVSNDSADNESRAYQAAVGVAPVPATFVKRRKPVITVQVVTGTAAANPVHPAVPSGFLRWADVWVPAASSGVIDVQNVRDWRLPAGFDTHTTWCFGSSGATPSGDIVNIPGLTGWAFNANGVLATTTNTAAMYIVPRLRARHDARLIRITIAGLLNHCAFKLVRLNMESTFGGIANETALADVSSSFNTGTDAPQILTATAITGTLLSGGANDVVPIWGNGEFAGLACYNAPKANPNDARLSTLALKVTAGASVNDYIKSVKWDFAAI